MPCPWKGIAITVVLLRDKGMPKGWLYDWEGMATMGRRNPETCLGRKLAYRLSVCVLTISNRCSEDSSCAHKGLMTNWPHHSTQKCEPQDVPQFLRTSIVNEMPTLVDTEILCLVRGLLCSLTGTAPRSWRRLFSFGIAAICSLNFLSGTTHLRDLGASYQVELVLSMPNFPCK